MGIYQIDTRFVWQCLFHHHLGFIEYLHFNLFFQWKQFIEWFPIISPAKYVRVWMWIYHSDHKLCGIGCNGLDDDQFRSRNVPKWSWFKRSMSTMYSMCCRFCIRFEQSVSFIFDGIVFGFRSRKLLFTIGNARECKGQFHWFSIYALCQFVYCIFGYFGIMDMLRVLCWLQSEI